MKAVIEGDTLKLELPISPRPSKSGKTILIASTSGGQKVDGLEYDGKAITVSVNAYIPR